MNKNDYIIRLETENDYRKTENLAREAFWNLSVPGCSEHYYMHVLRKHKDFIPQLDYVLELGGEIIASIMYTKAKFVDEEGNIKSVLSMGPLCVHPDYQRRGLGKALLEFTFEKAEKLGYDTVINFGNPDNYVARGYKSCKKYNVCLGNGVFPAALLVKVLKEDALDGRKWTYISCDAEAQCDDIEAVEEYDKLFPPKEKAWQPSQEEFYIHSHSSITW